MFCLGTKTPEKDPEPKCHFVPAKGIAMLRVTSFFLLTALVVGAPSILQAQGWSGNIGVAYLWADIDGSEDSFRSQTNLQEGFMLEDL